MSVGSTNRGMLLNDTRYDGCVVEGIDQATGARTILWAGELHDKGAALDTARSFAASFTAVTLDGKTYLPRYFHFHDSRTGTSRYMFV